MAPAIIPDITFPPTISNHAEAVRIARTLGGIVLSMDLLHDNPEAQAAVARRSLMLLIEQEAGLAAEHIKAGIEMFSPLGPPEKRAKIVYVGPRNAS